LLWQSVVPAGLDLPSVDPREFFSVAERERAEAYERLVRWLFLLTQLTAIAVLACYAAWGGRFARESAAGRIGTGMLLAMLGLGILWIVQLPFGLTELWWQRRHDISRVGYGEWILGTWLGLGGEFLFICFAILIVMGLAGPLPRWWWVPIPIRVQEVGTETTAPNAEAAGLGPTRRVILWDTLLDGRFQTDEVEVVLAHELGHHDREHIWKGVGWYALFAFPGAYLIARATRRCGGMREPQAVPLALLVLATLSFLALPVQNVITRHMEAEADWVALETTRDPDSATGLFRRFTTAALADPDPPTWSYVLVESHPTIVQRIAMAEAWERREGR